MLNVKIVTYEHNLARDFIESQLASKMLTQIKQKNINLSALAAPEIKNEIEQIFRQSGWSDRVSVSSDPQVRHYISGISGDIGFAAQFGNMAMCHGDLLKLQHLYQKGSIKSAFYILLTKNDRRAKSENYAQYEKLCKHIKLYKNIITVPILVLGIENE